MYYEPISISRDPLKYLQNSGHTRYICSMMNPIDCDWLGAIQYTGAMIYHDLSLMGGIIRLRRYGVSQC